MSPLNFAPSVFHIHPSTSHHRPSAHTSTCRTRTTNKTIKSHKLRRRRPRACQGDNNNNIMQILSSHDQVAVMPLIASLTPDDAPVFRRSLVLKSPNRAIRVSAHGALGRIGSAREDTAVLLASLCGLDDHSVRAASAGSLGDLHAASTDIPNIPNILPDITEVLQVLERYSSPASEAQYIVRYSCISALGIIGRTESIPFLTSVNATPLEISGAVTALGDIPHSENHQAALVYVRTNMAHGDDLVRGAIARTLGIWNLRDDLEEMQQNEENWYNSPHVRNMLAQALINE